jgi:flagellar hook assembly protein FlgD
MALVSCAAPRKAIEEVPPPEVKPEMEPGPFAISDTAVDSRTFRPTNGETVTITYKLSRPGKAIIKIFDPDMYLVRDLSGEVDKPGLNTVIWDGRDLGGRVVPDGAYFFVIEALDFERSLAIYDPVTFSGGESLVPVELTYDQEARVVRYQLAKDAWVKIRAGISGGPLLKTIVNMAPRLAGENEEFWDGKDDSGNVEIIGQRDWKLMAEATSLPENSVIAVGNVEYDYFEYGNVIAPDRPRKSKRSVARGDKWLLGLPTDRLVRLGMRPRFRFELPQAIAKTEANVPIVRGKVPLLIILDEEVKRYVTEQRYEIVFFVDFRFAAEVDEGYSPYKWVWDSRTARNGERIITVNVATLTGQVESASLKVLVKN